MKTFMTCTHNDSFMCDTSPGQYYQAQQFWGGFDQSPEVAVHACSEEHY